MVCHKRMDFIFFYQGSLRECNASEKACANGRCIPAKKWCDEVEDCIDGSDEKSCADDLKGSGHISKLTDSVM